jgi:hypothetical protein
MNNFYALLATDTVLQIKISLNVIHDNGFPMIVLRVNDFVVPYDVVTDLIEQEFKLPMTDAVSIEISMSDKKYSQDKETAVIINSVNIDGFEIVPGWTHLACYDTDRGQSGPTSYLGFNGKWSLQIKEPFYRWQHRITGQGWLLEPV